MKKSIEVLVATMEQTDFSLIDRMNIKMPAVIANQCGENRYDEVETLYGTVKMISTDTKGVGLNRNIALAYSSADIVLFADDDIEYNDDMPEKVLDAFEELPNADMIIFGMKYKKGGQIYAISAPKTERLKRIYSLKYGTCSMAIRKQALLAKDLYFSQLFGGGCIYSHGEDSGFIWECFRKKLKVYTHNYILGVTNKDSSVWFRGFDKKYFYDTGALAEHFFGIIKWPYIIRQAIRIKDTELVFFDRLFQMKRGVIGERKMIPYKD